MPRPIAVAASLPHSPESIFEFLSDLRNHWRLEERFVELGGIEEGGGRVRIKGPLGISREARTRVVAAEPPSTLRGSADIGRGTHGAVRWDIVREGAGSRVTFSAVVERASPLDRILLSAGGRWWLTRLFDNAVRRLGTELERD